MYTNVDVLQYTEDKVPFIGHFSGANYNGGLGKDSDESLNLLL